MSIKRPWRQVNRRRGLYARRGFRYTPLAGKEIRQSLKLREWQKAQDKIREWEAENQVVQAAKPQTITVAWKSSISNCKARELREGTIRKYVYLQRQTENFAERRGLRYAKELDVEILTKFRSEWKIQSFAALKQLERLQTFFRFCKDRGWVSDNPAIKIRNPKVEERPTLPSSQEEAIRIFAACEGFQFNGLTLPQLVFFPCGVAGSI